MNLIDEETGDLTERPVDEDIGENSKNVGPNNDSVTSDIIPSNDAEQNIERRDSSRKKVHNEFDNRSRRVGVFKMGSTSGSVQVVNETVNLDRAVINGSISYNDDHGSTVATLISNAQAVEYVEAVEAVPVDDTDLLKQLMAEKKRNKTLLILLVAVLFIVGVSVTVVMLVSSKGDDQGDSVNSMKGGDDDKINPCKYRHGVMCKSSYYASGWCKTSFCECDDESFDREIPSECEEFVTYPCGDEVLTINQSRNTTSRILQSTTPDSSMDPPWDSDEPSLNDTIPMCVAEDYGMPLHNNSYCEIFLAADLCPF